MLKLTMTCGPYDRARALIEKKVVPEGIDLDIAVNRKNPGKITHGPDGRPFDVIEFYTGAYMADLPYRRLGYTAIPIFVKRMFRHSYIYINNKSGIRSPKDLDGKRIGLQNWFTSAAIWARGALEDDWGLDIKSVDWVAQHEDSEGEDWTPPPWLKLELAPKGSKHMDSLAAGEIQALILTAVAAPNVHPNIDFLFPNYAELERDYYKRTGFFPIMHTLLIRTELLEREPWVAMSMFNAWMASKQALYDEMKWQRVHMTALWYRALREEEMAVGGEDFYRWGFTKTRFEVDKMLEYVHRYGMVPYKSEPEDMFHPSTLNT
jgi:4,5-dihydroxyphthalate decarboxylase